ncbi:MAG: hypothetical protein IJ870_05345 [Alphaproteobacteria bacterium]|nr:hypothetical protein [Alphaproteobacteria bacterium]
MDKKILINDSKVRVYNFGFATYAELGSTSSLIGRNICSLTAPEKENTLIQKLLGRIRLPSKRELDELNRKFEVYSLGGKARLIEKDHADKEYPVYNLGTIDTPAFFYDKFIFVLNRRERVFEPQDLNVVYFNDNYALLMVGENLLITFDVKGLKCVGNFISVTKVPRGYIIMANAPDKDDYDDVETVYAANKTFQKLFENSDFSDFDIDYQTGTIMHEYTNFFSIPIGCVVDVYVPRDSGYILVNHHIE